MKRILKPLIFTLLLFIFFSYKLTQVPVGLTVDEASFGYNAISLSQTLRDENNRLLPIFILSIGGTDWRQPITQYFIAGFFKLFSPSFYTLRITSVIVAVLSVILAYILGKLLLGKWGGMFTGFFVATTPILMIHSHLALDNIYPLPFIFIWLIFLVLYEKEKRLVYLVISAISLGMGFYSYKGARVFIPTWCALSVIYLFFFSIVNRNKDKLREKLKSTAVFFLAVLPFFAIIPLLEFKYAGAVLNNAKLGVGSLYKFIYFYFSTFDPSFLFVKGDEIIIHSTGQHGMLLLTSLPFFIVGLVEAFKKNRFWKFLIASFFLGTLLYGSIGPVNRASRIMAIIPLYGLVCALGAVWLSSKNIKTKAILLFLSVLVFINYFDFINHYWFEFADNTKHLYYGAGIGDSYKILNKEAEKRGLTPLVHDLIVKDESEGDRFFRSLSFFLPPTTWCGNIDRIDDRFIVMSNDPNIKGLDKLEVTSGNMYYYVEKE